MTIENFCRELDRELLLVECCEDKVRVTETMLGKLSVSDFDCCHKWGCESDKYARHLVYRSDNSGCCIVAMSWGPGQGTPVHDHDGTWCVECCLEGRLEIVQYEIEGTETEQDETLYKLGRRQSQHVGPGAVGCLIPPFEHHTILNPFEERAVTLHVYGKELMKSSCFVPIDAGEELFRRIERPLGYAQRAMA